MDHKQFEEWFDVGLLISLRIQLMFTIANCKPHKSALNQIQHHLKYDSEPFIYHNCIRNNNLACNNHFGLEKIIRKIEFTQ
jgi:hypothetical protein